jgi:hypothetical protein
MGFDEPGQAHLLTERAWLPGREHPEGHGRTLLLGLRPRRSSLDLLQEAHPAEVDRQAPRKER